MTNPNLPAPPNGLAVMSPVQAASVLGEWLMDVARLRGEEGLDYAIGAGWPGDSRQRALMPEAHITSARNEAKQLASWRA